MMHNMVCGHIGHPGQDYLRVPSSPSPVLNLALSSSCYRGSDTLHMVVILCLYIYLHIILLILTECPFQYLNQKSSDP